MIREWKLEKVRKFMEGRTLFIANYEIASALNLSIYEVGHAMSQLGYAEKKLVRDPGGRLATLYRYETTETD